MLACKIDAKFKLTQRRHHFAAICSYCGLGESFEGGLTFAACRCRTSLRTQVRRATFVRPVACTVLRVPDPAPCPGARGAPGSAGRGHGGRDMQFYRSSPRGDAENLPFTQGASNEHTLRIERRGYDQPSRVQRSTRLPFLKHCQAQDATGPCAVRRCLQGCLAT